MWGAEVPLIDLELGLDALMLNLNPKHSWADLVRFKDTLEPALLEGCLSEHDSGVRLLAAPPTPAMSGQVSPGAVSTVLNMLRERHEYTVIDTASDFSDVTLAALDPANSLLLPFPPDLASLKATATALDVLVSLGYEEFKLVPIINCTFARGGLLQERIEATLGMSVKATIPYEPSLFVESINRGQPFVLTHPRASASVAIERLACMIS